MMKLKMPEAFVPESEIVGDPRRVDWTAQNYRGWNWVPIEWEQIVRDGDGNIIFTNIGYKTVVAMLSEALGKPFFAVYFVDARSDYVEQVAFGLPAGMSLGAEESAAVAMAAWTNNRYFPGVQRSEALRLPEAVNKYTAAPDSCIGLDAIFYSIDDANRMASVVSSLYDARTKVIRHGDQWGVVVNDKRFADSRRILELCGIHKLMSKYSIEPMAKHKLTARAFSERIEEQAAFESRIEDAVAAILARLGGPADAAPDSVLSPVGEAFANMHHAESTPEAKLAATIEADGGLIPTIEAPRKRPAAKTAKAKAAPARRPVVRSRKAVG